ncbi:fatty acid hydroxylase superfamily-domain-containing protein [Mycena leptocephala]|nr:fatty acid hydroxylase superfamily-domain-containing protein [Mycena leptocephala]
MRRFQQRPWYYSHKPSLIDGVSDTYVALAAPVIAYWTSALMFHYLDTCNWPILKRYRIHESTEVASRNRASRTAVVSVAIIQHLLQTTLGLIGMEERQTPVNHVQKVAAIRQWLTLTMVEQGEVADCILSRMAQWVYWWGIPLLQFLFAMFIIDTWQYFVHRYMHMNKFLYRHIHSWHHRLYVPYAFGALYNHPLEGLLGDSLGALVGKFLSGMSLRQATLLFTVATLKSVDDHCGYCFPFDPFYIMLKNNTEFHDIHHQNLGMKSNFSAPFFVHWDILLGTYMTREEIELRRQKEE